MINYLLHFFTSKEIILYNKHRQTEPLANNLVNKKNYHFFDVDLIWKFIPFKTTDKRKHRIMYLLLNLIQPKYILSMNWISQRESLYKVWTTKHPKSKFIVMQHGGFVGGIIVKEDLDHKYTKCDIFLTWGPFFVEEFKKYNSLKKVEVINFGNSVYNEYNRTNYHYKEKTSNKVLVTPTALDQTNIEILYTLINRLKKLDFNVDLKPHAFQGKTHGGIEYPTFEGVTVIKTELYTILQNNNYEYIISDHSSSLLDAIFFKNKIVYFDPNNNRKGYTTQYSKYLKNLFTVDFNNITKTEIYDLISLENQEALLNNMISCGTNEIP